MVRCCALICCLVLFVIPALAQEPPVFELPEVIVPGHRPQPISSTPAAVTVITREELEHLGARTVADALLLVPEAMVRSYGGFGSLSEASIRGFGPGQVLVLLDGVPLNNVALGQADLSTISTMDVERIEVLRGPFGALSGSGAVGGVINIVTTRGHRPTAEVRYGGYGERLLRLSAATGAAQLSVEAAGAEGFRPNSDGTGMTLIGQIEVHPTLRVMLHHYRADLGTPGDIAFPTPADRQSAVRTVAQAQWETTDALTRARVFAVNEFLEFRSPLGNSTYRSRVLGGEWQRRWDVAPGRLLVAGAEVQEQRLDASVFGSAVLQTVGIGAGYLEYDAALSPNALVSLGARADLHSAYGATINPRLGMVYTVDDRTRIRASLGRTFRGPTFLHLYYPDPRCSNPTLRPELSWSAEVGVERVSGTLTGTLTAYAVEATDLISGGCPPQNIGAASVRGVSGELRGRFTPRLTGVMHVTVQQAIDRATGAALPRVPGVVVGAALTYATTPASALTFLGEYVGARPDLDFSVFPAATVQLSSYINLGLRYQWHSAAGWTMTVGVDNLLDASYEIVKGYPVPGRTVFVSTSRRF